jgi:hypothetical protein
VVTSSDDVANGRNKVLPAERDAFIDSFRARSGGQDFHFRPTLSGAIAMLLDDVGEDDLVVFWAHKVSMPRRKWYSNT